LQSQLPFGHAIYFILFIGEFFQVLKSAAGDSYRVHIPFTLTHFPSAQAVHFPLQLTEVKAPHALTPLLHASAETSRMSENSVRRRKKGMRILDFGM
jgi:hypothetical protein